MDPIEDIYSRIDYLARLVENLTGCPLTPREAVWSWGGRTVPEAAREFGISQQVLGRLIRAGELVVSRNGTARVIARLSLMRWLDRHRERAETQPGKGRE